MVFKKVIKTYSGVIVVCGLISKYNGKRKNVCNVGAGYAGLIMCLVAFVFCDTATDPSKSLTYDKIYNNTNYVHLPHRSRTYSLPMIVHKPYKTVKVKHQRYNVSEEGTTGNELEYEEYNDIEAGDGRNQLLVGVAHDPFRYSIPEEDYIKGVRVMEPSAYMKKNENRGKRGVLHLYNMVSCTTGCNPLTYVGYGCYCGFLGDGRPTDGIDECCRIHDKCYENFRCPFYTVYFQPYLWKCSERQALCALENYKTQYNFINGCAAQLCECDRQFAMCIKKYRCPKRKSLCVTSPIRLLQNFLFG